MYELIKNVLVVLLSSGLVVYLIKSYIDMKMNKSLKKAQEKIDIRMNKSSKELQEEIDMRLEQFSEVLKEKREAYRGYVGMYMDIISSEGNLSRKDVRKRSYKFYGSLILYANPITFKAFTDFMQYLYKSEYKFDKEALRLFGKVILCMREEIGSSNKGLKEFDILKGVIKDHAKLLKG